MPGLWLSSGALVWAAHFTALYGFTALACARGFAAAVPWVAAFATFAALGALGLIAYVHLGRRGEFHAWMTLAVAGLAVLAVVYETIPVFIVSACA
jgi:hypothetical protein